MWGGIIRPSQPLHLFSVSLLVLPSFGEGGQVGGLKQCPQGLQRLPSLAGASEEARNVYLERGLGTLLDPLKYGSVTFTSPSLLS